MTLQNFFHQTDNAYYTSKGIIYSEDSNGRIKLVIWEQDF